MSNKGSTFEAGKLISIFVAVTVAAGATLAVGNYMINEGVGNSGGMNEVKEKSRGIKYTPVLSK